MGTRDPLSAAPDEVAVLRTPPQSIEAEQSVLGGLLIDGSKAWDRIAGAIDERDFYRNENATIFGAITGLLTERHPVDVVTVHDRLSSIGMAEECGGLVYLNALAQSVPSAANIGRYVQIVRERAVLRQIIVYADTLAASAFNPGGLPVSQILDSAAMNLAAIAPPRGEREGRLLTELAEELCERLRADHAQGGADPGIATGFPTLDRLMVGGIKPSWVVVLAARPKVGKTSLAAHLTLRAAEVGPVLVLSLEMRNDEIAMRMLANAGRIDQQRLKSAMLDEDDWRRLDAAASEVRRLNDVLIDDEAALTLPRIAAKVRRARRRLGPLALIVIDYLQLAEGTDSRLNRTLQLGQITGGLKRIAKEENTAILLLSQLSRAPETRPGREPQPSDLRDSGSIEQDADAVLMAWPFDDDLEAERRLIGMSLPAFRHGPTGAFVLDFQPSLGQWHESTTSIADMKRRRGAKQQEDDGT